MTNATYTNSYWAKALQEKARSSECPVQPGEFISVPAWRTFGMVLETEPAQYGPDGSIRVLLQEDPDSDTGVWYNLEPGSYTVE